MAHSDLREKSALVPVKQRAPQPARPSPQFTHPVEILVQAAAVARHLWKRLRARVDAARQRAPSARRSSRPSAARRTRQPTSTGWAVTSTTEICLLVLQGGWGGSLSTCKAQHGHDHQQNRAFLLNLRVHGPRRIRTGLIRPMSGILRPLA